MSHWTSPTAAIAATATAAVATAIFAAARVRSHYPRQKLVTQPGAIASPRASQLSRKESAAHPYPPDLLPGARDVATPYGMMRVYEWGPEDGRKVVMVPGDTTPAPIFSVVAQALVPKGLRVLIVDTWGRGYSDAPTGVPYDARLFMMQVFFAVSSSPIAWTGEAAGGFSMIGFSLGGSVVMSFAATFPYLVNSIVLLAPGGMIRTLPDGYDSFFFRYRDFVPTAYLRKLAGTVLGVDMSSRRPRQRVDSDHVKPETLDMPALWQWQFDEHQGFVHAFIDTTQNGPLQRQHDDWKVALDIISDRSQGSSDVPLKCRLRDTKLLVICGDSDAVVVADEVREELMRMTPEGARIVFHTVPGGHGFPIPSGMKVVKHIVDFWGLDE